MSSLQARLAAFLVRHRLKPALGDMSDPLRVRAAMGAPLPVPKGARYEAGEVGGVRGEWVERVTSGKSPATAPLGTLLYLHGGGFVGCSPRSHRPNTAAFALLGWRVFVPDYRLAPEHPFPAAALDAIAAWRGLVALRDFAQDTPTRTGTRPSAATPGSQPARPRLAVAGDSAGGNLALSLMVHERDAGRLLPDAAALFSPAIDLSGQSPSLWANGERDAMFRGEALATLVQAYLQGADPTQALASPLLAPLHGLPPILVHAGVDETLRDDATRLAARGREAGVHTRVQLWPDVPHVWQLVARLPEARQSLAQASAWMHQAAPLSEQAPEELDVLIVGAGLSGIGAAAALQTRCPDQRIGILEARAAIGGTWDLFRYPGVRSDSDMYTLGYRFKPWLAARAIADGPAIRDYIHEVATEHGLAQQVRHDQRVTHLDWRSSEARWHVRAEQGPDRHPVHLRARFVDLCSGYYSYAQGHRPEFAGEADYTGRIVHPQFWPEGLDLTGRRVVVIGSGATAVTLVPELARTAAHVTLLQRSPTYVVSLPAVDRLAEAFKRHLPARWAYRLVRTKNILLQQVFYKIARRWPGKTRDWIVAQARAQLGPGVDAAHFTPSYAPWDQRVCSVPDGDLFHALRSGRAEVVTDHIERFTRQGLRLCSGRELEADVVVTATGLKVELMGGIALSVDGQPVHTADLMGYKAMMFAGVPNLVMTFGYTNASWTLKADLTAGWLARLVTHLRDRGLDMAVPRRDPGVRTVPFLDFSSGYVQRAAHLLPTQGHRRPWRVTQNFFVDLLTLRWGRLADGHLHMSRKPAGPPGP